MSHCRYPMGKRLLITLSTSNTIVAFMLPSKDIHFLQCLEYDSKNQLRNRHKALTFYRWVFANSAEDILEDWHIAKAVFHEYPARQGIV